MGNSPWQVVIVSVAIAFGTLLVQIFLKHISRPHSKDRRSSVELDEWVVWTDWAILGGLAYFLSIAAHMHQPELHFPLAASLWGGAFLLAQGAVMPAVLKEFAYTVDEAGRTRIKSGTWAFACNAASGMLLALVVLSGINVYDWTGSGL